MFFSFLPYSAATLRSEVLSVLLFYPLSIPSMFLLFFFLLFLQPLRLILMAMLKNFCSCETLWWSIGLKRSLALLLSLYFLEDVTSAPVDMTILIDVQKWQVTQYCCLAFYLTLRYATLPRPCHNHFCTSMRSFAPEPSPLELQQLAAIKRIEVHLGEWFFQMLSVDTTIHMHCKS